MNTQLPHSPLFFEGWYNVGRASLLAFLGFLSLMILLRLSGKRTLSNLTAFDFVFVVAVGELLAHTVLSKEVTLAEGLAAILTMIVFQLVVSRIAQRWESVGKFINGEPTLLFAHGRFLPRALKKERITEAEVRAAIRLQGVTRVEDVTAVILETDGELSVAWESKGPGSSSLVDAAGVE
jgi:uncharacterized membrane protein YcaP (DUF421 family)